LHLPIIKPLAIWYVSYIWPDLPHHAYKKATGKNIEFSVLQAHSKRTIDKLLWSRTAKEKISPPQGIFGPEEKEKKNTKGAKKRATKNKLCITKYNIKKYE